MYMRLSDLPPSDDILSKSSTDLAQCWYDYVKTIASVSLKVSSSFPGEEAQRTIPIKCLMKHYLYHVTSDGTSKVLGYRYLLTSLKNRVKQIFYLFSQVLLNCLSCPNLVTPYHDFLHALKLQIGILTFI